MVMLITRVTALGKDEVTWENVVESIDPALHQWANGPNQVEKRNANVCRAQQSPLAELTQAAASASIALRKPAHLLALSK